MEKLKNILDWCVQTPIKVEDHIIAETVNGKITERIITIRMLIRFEKSIVISKNFNKSVMAIIVSLYKEQIVDNKLASTWPGNFVKKCRIR